MRRTILNSPSVTEGERTRAKEQIKQFGAADKSFLEATKSVAKMAADPAFVHRLRHRWRRGVSQLRADRRGAAGQEPAPVDNLESLNHTAADAHPEPGWFVGGLAHCISGKTFCTAAALLSLMSDLASVPVAEKLKK